MENSLLPRMLLPAGSMAARLRNGVSSAQPTPTQAPRSVIATENAVGQKSIVVESPVPWSSGRAVSGGRTSPLGQRGRSLLALVDHKVLCSKCESVANEAVREAEHKARGLVELAKSLKRPSLPAPSPPGAEAAGGHTLHSNVDDDQPAAVNRTLLPAMKPNDSTPPATKTSSLSPMGDGEMTVFSFPFSSQLDAKPVEMKDITGKQNYPAPTRRHFDLSGCKLCFDSVVCLCRRRDASRSTSYRSRAREARNNYPISATPPKNGCRLCKMRPLHPLDILRPEFPNRDAPVDV